MTDWPQPCQASPGNGSNYNTTLQIGSSITNGSIQQDQSSIWPNAASFLVPDRNQKIKRLNLKLSTLKLQYKKIGLDLLNHRKARASSQNIQTDGLDEQEATLEVKQQLVDVEIKKVEVELDELHNAGQTQELFRVPYGPVSYFPQTATGSLEPVLFNEQHNIGEPHKGSEIDDFQGLRYDPYALDIPALTGHNLAPFNIPQALSVGEAPSEMTNWDSRSDQLCESNLLDYLPSGNNDFTLDACNPHPEVPTHDAELRGAPDMPTVQPHESFQPNQLNSILQNGTDWEICEVFTTGDSESHLTGPTIYSSQGVGILGSHPFRSVEASDNIEYHGNLPFLHLIVSEIVEDRQISLPLRAIEYVSVSTIPDSLNPSTTVKAATSSGQAPGGRRGRKRRSSIPNHSGFQVLRFGPEPVPQKRVRRSMTEDQRLNRGGVKAEGGACWTCHYGHIRVS